MTNSGKARSRSTTVAQAVLPQRQAVAVGMILIVALSLLGACNREPPREPQVRRPAEVTRESLLAQWRDYEGQDVVVEGVITFGEGATMYLPQLPLSPRTEESDAEAMWVIPSERVQKRPDELERQYLEYRWMAAVAKLRGRFTVAARDRRFGHLSCCRFKLVFDEVLTFRPATSADR
jgi:hypothetical protein